MAAVLGMVKAFLMHVSPKTLTLKRSGCQPRTRHATGAWVFRQAVVPTPGKQCLIVQLVYFKQWGALGLPGTCLLPSSLSQKSAQVQIEPVSRLLMPRSRLGADHL